jgi:UDP-N-acetylmuramoyl-L-alanyl-D-glutamate--2,6-diaminopimelate ligase
MMQLRELCRDIGRLEAIDDGDLEVGRIDHDSRTVDQSSLFMALAGRQTSGLKYVAQAIERGAVAIGVEEGSERPSQAPAVVWFKSARKDMATLAARVVQNPQSKMDIVAVTGTNGKTSVTTILHGILQKSTIRSGLIGTISTQIGDQVLPTEMTTPESTDLYRLLQQMHEASVEVVCMEYSSVGIEEHRVNCTNPKLAIYLNLSQDHLDYHGTMAAYGEAKAKLFTKHLAIGGTALISIDDAFGGTLYDEIKKVRPDVVCLSVSAVHHRADVVGDLTSARHGISGTVQMGDTCLHVDSRLLGQFNCQNMTMAIAAAQCLGVPEADIVSGILDCAIPGRLEQIELTEGAKVVIDYAHTPEALASALDALRPLTHGRLVCVFGCGGDRDGGKRPLMAAAASRADLVIITSDNPRWESATAIIDDILPGLEPTIESLVEVDRRQAIETALKRAQTDDLVLIAGKGHEDYQEIEGVRRPFSDRKCVHEWQSGGGTG